MSSALAIRHTTEDDTARRNAESNAHAKRYRPGKAPEWGDKEAADTEDGDVKQEPEADELEDSLAATKIAAPVVVRKVADPRLARLSVKRQDSDEEVAAPRIVSRRQARDVSDEESGESENAKSESDHDEEDLEARRAAVKARLQSKRNETEEIMAGVEEEEEEEEESEYETDTDEEQVGRQLLKPVFVRKQDRDTIAEREAQERAELEQARKEKAKVEARKHETREILISTITAEAKAAKAAREGPKEVGDIDTDDEKDLDAEYDSWRIRELQRIRRTREEREQMQEAEDERERIKNMTDEERRRWERENPKIVHQAPKKSWKFQQKYWHKGAFYQEVSDNPHAAGSQPDDIYFRDYSAPTGEDKLNKEILPKVMQVKNFGRRGRTKYTHLVDQDTTSRDDYYNQEGIRKPNRRLAGTDQKFNKPKQFNT